MMKELLLYMARNLVEHPDAVTVTEIPGDVTVLELRVAPDITSTSVLCRSTIVSKSAVALFQ